MSRQVFFYPEFDRDRPPGWQLGHHARTDQEESLSRLLAEHFNYSPTSSPPTRGDRLTEYKHDAQAASFDHGVGITHYRPGPWQVTRVDEYVGNTGQEHHDAVYICLCIYDPLPEAENPWVEMAPAIVSPDSFGGDVAAYEAWKAEHQSPATVGA